MYVVCMSSKMKVTLLRTRLSRLVALGGVLTLLATGCSEVDSNQRSADGSPGTTRGVHGQVEQAAANYETILTNQSFIERAEQELIRRCMVKAGFKYTPVDPLPIQLRQLTLPLSVQAASESGYASVILPVSGPQTEANAAYVSSLSAANRKRYNTTLIGSLGPNKGVDVTNALGKIRVSSGGCRRQADAELFGDPVKWANLSFFISNLGNLPQYKPQDNSTLQNATKKWSSCMEDKGYRFADPDAALNQAFLESSPTNATDAQGNAIPAQIPGIQPGPVRDQAVADATCRAKTGWDDANRAAAQQALAAVLAAHESEVLAYNEMARAGVAKARTVLGQ